MPALATLPDSLCLLAARARADASTPSAACFGAEDYCQDALVAEIGTAAPVHHAGVEASARPQSNAAYIQSRLGVLRGEERFTVSAAYFSTAFHAPAHRAGHEKRQCHNLSP